jgi:hypothetical protein
VGVEPVGLVAAVHADHGVVDGRLDEPMYTMTSVATLVVSPSKVVTARAFQSVITVGSSAATVVGVAALAVPPARAATRTAAARTASQLRIGAALVFI